MVSSKNKNNRQWQLIVTGFVFGILLTVFGGVLAYQTVTGKKIISRWHYVLDKGKEHVASFSKDKLSPMPQKPQDQKSNLDHDGIYLEIDASQVIRPINPMIYGSNLSAKAEFEMDVAKFSKELGITNLRYPGGGSPGYRWKQSKYDYEDRFDKAPLSDIKNIIKFTDIAAAEIVVQVNIESGTAQEAAEWVEYMNKGPGSRVNYWELGNEIYGDWDRAHMTGEEYVQVIKEYTKLMREADPTIKIGANWGGIKYQEFDTAIAQGAFDDIDFVSYHWYPNHINKRHRYKGRVHPLPKEIMANSLAVKSLVDRLERMIEKYAPHRKGKIEFTIMEWDGSWDGTASDLNYEYKGMMWSLANAIFYANALGEFAKQGITVANNYTLQEIMFGFIRGWDIDAGWGGSRWDGETVRPKGWAFKMLANHFRGNLVQSTLSGSPVYIKEVDWRPDAYSGEVPYVQGYVSQSRDLKTMSIVLTNQHADKDYEVKIAIKNASLPKPQGEAWILNGPNLKSQNDGSPGTVNISQFNLSGIKNKFTYTIPAHSVNLLKISFHE